VRIRRGRPPRLELDIAEAGLVHTLATQVLALLSDEGADGAAAAGDPLADIVGPLDSGAPASDPVVARLLPDAYRDDEEAAADWRRLGRGDVRAVKTGALAQVLADVGGEAPLRLSLDDERVTAWLAVLTDIRLALSTRLGIAEEWVDELTGMAPDDPRRTGYEIYDWLSMVQESILRAVG
jgi:hypothetical protein